MATLPIHTIPNQYSDLPNSIAMSNDGELCTAWKGQGNDFIYIIFNGDQGVPNWDWENVTTVKDVTTKHAPSICYFGNRLFIAWINDSVSRKYSMPTSQVTGSP